LDGLVVELELKRFFHWFLPNFTCEPEIPEVGQASQPAETSPEWET
jgi:hypothetical protein